MSHALATVLHRGRKAASNIMAACLASSREAPLETGKARRRWTHFIASLSNSASFAGSVVGS